MAYRLQALACALILVLAGCSRGPKTCAVCQRDECTGMAFRVTLESGKVVETCCPRCGLHYLESTREKARAFQATDFASGVWIDAQTAFFVSGSDVHACAHPQALRDAQGCCMLTTYDRCLPSLAAFHDRDAAVTFQKEHGGKLITFANLLSNPVLTENPAGGKS
jgi:hypothetical protein